MYFSELMGAGFWKRDMQIRRNIMKNNQSNNEWGNKVYLIIFNLPAVNALPDFVPFSHANFR